MSSARATIAAWLAGEPSSSSSPRSLVRSYSSRSAGPRLRAIRMAFVRQHARLAAVAGQVAQQPVVEVLQVVDALAQVGIARLAEAGAMLGAHPLDRRLGRQAASAPPRPASGSSCGCGPASCRSRAGRSRRPSTAWWPSSISSICVCRSAMARCSRASSAVGSSLSSFADRHRRLVQHGDAEREAVGQLHAAQPLRPLRRDLDVLQLRSGRAARRPRPSRPAPWR